MRGGEASGTAVALYRGRRASARRVGRKRRKWEAHYKENQVKTRRLDHMFCLPPAHDFSHSTCSHPTRLLFDGWVEEATCPAAACRCGFGGKEGRAAEETRQMCRCASRACGARKTHGPSAVELEPRDWFHARYRD